MYCGGRKPLTHPVKGRPSYNAAWANSTSTTAALLTVHLNPDPHIDFAISTAVLEFPFNSNEDLCCKPKVIKGLAKFHFAAETGTLILQEWLKFAPSQVVAHEILLPHLSCRKLLYFSFRTSEHLPFAVNRPLCRGSRKRFGFTELSNPSARSWNYARR